VVTQEPLNIIVMCGKNLTALSTALAGTLPPQLEPAKGGRDADTLAEEDRTPSAEAAAAARTPTRAAAAATYVPLHTHALRICV
jgi:hypothetical protein